LSNNNPDVDVYMWIQRVPDVGQIWDDTMLLSGKANLIYKLY